MTIISLITSQKANFSHTSQKSWHPKQKFLSHSSHKNHIRSRKCPRALVADEHIFALRTKRDACTLHSSNCFALITECLRTNRTAPRFAAEAMSSCTQNSRTFLRIEDTMTSCSSQWTSYFALGEFHAAMFTEETIIALRLSQTCRCRIHPSEKSSQFPQRILPILAFAVCALLRQVV
jgi:hypothetical protein